MSDSTTLLDTISSGQSSKEVTANALFDAMSPSSLFGRRASTTAALTWGFYGGVVNVGGSLQQVANGTIALTDNATNYLEFDETDTDLVVKNTSGWTPGLTKLYEIVTSGGAVTSYEDWRTGSTAAALPSGAGDVVGPASAGNNKVALFDGTTGKLIKDSGLTLAGTNTGDETAQRIGDLINAATAKATPVNADFLGLMDSAAGNILKKLSWQNVKATLNTYFDTLYMSVAPTIVTVTYAATISVDLTGQPNNTIFRCTLTGNVTVNITGGSDGQKAIIELIQDATGSRIVTLGADFGFGTDITSFTATTTASKADTLGVIFNSAAAKYRVLAVAKGFAA